jgi:uncharacterized membrane protein
VLRALLPGVYQLQNIHPLLVHFPIALLPAATLTYCLAIIGRRDSWAWAGLWMLSLGALGAAAAVASGLWAAPGVMLAVSVKEHLLYPHRNLMLAVLGLSVALTVWALIARPLPRRGRYAFIAMLIVLVAMIAKGADYGGRMVYDYNAGGNACGQPIDFSR